MKTHRKNHWLTGMFTAAVAFAAVVGITPKTEAQTYQPQYITLLDGAITAGSTSNTTHKLDVRRNLETVAISLTGTASSIQPGSSLTLTFKPSVDGVNFATSPTLTWVWTIGAVTNMTPITMTTNLTVGGYGYLQLSSIAASSNTNSITINSFSYGVKNPAAP